MWDTRYRPVVFSDVLGQEGAVKVLRARLVKGEASDTSYIFAGGHGSGKTTLARILARAMLCLELRPDGDPCNACEHCLACLNETMPAFTELDAASQGTTADMRRLVEHLSYDLPGVKKRIYLLDEAHRMSRDAQDVLLKPIEDKRVVVLFCTTEAGKIRETISSRCECHEIRRIPREDILARAQVILGKQGVEFEDEAVLMVIDHARGHVRDVLNSLETIAQLGPITTTAVRERLDLTAIPLYYDILLALGDPARAISQIESACERQAASRVAAGLAEAAMNAFRHANKIHTDYSQVDQQRAALVYERFGHEVTGLARYFLGLGTHVTRLDLVCAAVAFNGPNVPSAPTIVSVPPVVINVAAAQSAAPSAPPVAPSAPPVAPPASPVASSAPSSPPTASLAAMPAARALAVPATAYVDNNEPWGDDDAAQMTMPDVRPKGVGHSNPGYKLAPKQECKPAREEAFGFTRDEFTATFHELLGIVVAHGK